MKRTVLLTLLTTLTLVSCPLDPNSGSCGFNNCRVNLDFSASGVVLEQGGSASISITPKSDNGYMGSIEINVSNVPEGVKYSLAPSTVVIGGSPSSSVLTVNAAIDAPTGNPVEVTVNAIGKNSIGTSNKFKMTIKPKGSLPTATAITLSPKKILVNAGGAVQPFVATINGAGTVKWQLIPAIGTLSSSTGTSVTYTPPSSVTTKTDVALMAMVDGTSVSDSAIITVNPAAVTPPPPPTTLAITPKTPSVNGGGTQNFSATINGTGTVNWALSPTTGGSLSSSTGTSVTYTAPAATSSNQTVTLTASVQGTNLQDTAKITIPSASTPPPPPATTVTISPKPAYVGAGSNTQGFTATLNGTGTVTWALGSAVGSLSSTTGTTVTYTSPPDTLTVDRTVSISATVNGVTDSATISIAATPASGITVSPTSTTASAGGGAAPFTATVNGPAWPVNWTISPNIGVLSSGTGLSVAYTPPVDTSPSVRTVTLTANTQGATNTATITIPATPPTPPPGAPGSFTATATSSSTIDLSWTAATGVTAYTLERGSGPNFTFAQIASPSASATTYQDSGLTGGTLYQYRLTAINSGGSSPSVGISIITPLPAATTIAITPKPGAAMLVSDGGVQTFKATINGAGTVTWIVTLGSLSATTGTSVDYSTPTNTSTATRTATLTATVNGVSDSTTISIPRETIPPCRPANATALTPQKLPVCP